MDYKIKKASFIKSSTKPEHFPKKDLPEYAFIGRSNVGKSSLLNKLANNNKLAKISSSPGKTITVNHYLIDEKWYLADLPGYGYAKRSKADRRKYEQMILNYIGVRNNIVSLFILIDSRIPPKDKDINFINLMGKYEVPFYLVFTKADKIKMAEKDSLKSRYSEALKQTWEIIPEMFITSSKTGEGCNDLLNRINTLNREIIINKK